MAWPQTLNLDSILPFWKRMHFDPAAQPLLLAVSGGADSMAMLHFFARENISAKPLKLHIAHINHGLRVDASQDADLIKSVCAKYGFPFYERALNPSSRLPRESLEAWARRERYQALHEIGQTQQVDLMLTAHHRDDFVETQLLRLERGEGWRAFTGLPFSRPGLGYPNHQVLRPFLPLPVLTLRAYLKSIGATWREDSTNADTRLTRNRLRKHTLPQWEANWNQDSHSPQISSSQQTTSTSPSEVPLRERLFSLGWALQALLPRIEALESEDLPHLDQIEAQTIALESKAFENLLVAGDLDLVTKSLRQAVGLLGGPVAHPALRSSRAILLDLSLKPENDLATVSLPDVSHSSVKNEAVNPSSVRSTSFGPTSRQFDLGQGFFFQVNQESDGIECQYRVIQNLLARKKGQNNQKKALFNQDELQTCEPESIKVILDATSGKRDITLGQKQWRLTYRFFSRPQSLIFPESNETRTIITAKGMSTLEIRTRQAGDRFSPLGLSSQSRKLKAFLNERKVPTQLRDFLPLVFIEGLLAWVPGYGISDSFKVNASHETLLELGLQCLTP